MPRTYFPFYFTFYESAQTMKPKMRAAFYEAIIEYGVTGNKPTLPSSIAGYWPMIKKALDTSKQRYDAGEKGGKASKESRFGSNNKKNSEKNRGRCQVTLRELRLQHIKRFNHPPGGSPCPTCNGSGHYLVEWSSPNLYFGLLTMCPTCRRYEVTNNLWWWEWILPEIQEEYSRALNASTGERRNE